jgi:prepilin-type N-terminal cleavage/methylation domain-containing protein
MKHVSSSKGFTLIELIISIAIFAIFLIVMAGVFTSFVKVQRHSIAQGAVILDLRSAVESFIKEARTGYGSTYNANGRTEIAFRNQTGACVSYRVYRGAFQRAENPSNLSGNCRTGQFADTVYVPLTSTETQITDIFFDTTISDYTRSTLALKNQGVITLSITARSAKVKTLPVIQMENTITSRQVGAYNE